MKTFFFYTAILLSVMASCQNANNNNNMQDTDDNEARSEGQKKVSKRDYSITKANSYSTLFMDSTAMEKFIAGKKLSDSVARRMRSFYNTRNYQFAWFS
ncbi:MAG TPA: hypothetical protein VFR58_10495, partial [Flavisolibacter sp.]|nr:hypothetical protein [Flavisolibacter sp.]